MARRPLTRRQFNRAVSLAAAGVAVGACKGQDDDSAEPALVPRGAILITADDLGWKDLGAYGLSSAIPTPALDRLVAEGVAFDNAFDVVSTCSSSRATLATGQYPHTHGVTGLVHRHPELSLPVEHPTMMRILSEAGFGTAIQGKWHLTAYEDPPAFGYDQYLPTDIDQVIRESEQALAFVEAHKGRSFYLELNYMQTHRDLFGEFPQIAGYEVSVDDATPPEWWGLPDWPEIREEVAGYFSALRWMDDLIGQLLDGLDQLGLAEDTLIAFVSDNGPAFPGCKTTVYDRGLGTPLIFRWPRGLASARHDELLSSVDVAPTLLDLLGQQGLDAAEGRSIAPLLLGDPAWTPATEIFAEMERHGGDGKPARSVRTDRYKLIRNLTEDPWGSGAGDDAWKDPLAEEPDQTWDEPRPPLELFDLDSDPLERNNLADTPEHADLQADLLARLEDWMTRTNDFRLPELRR